MIDIRTVTGKLGEKEYEIREAGFAVSKPWKQRLLADIKPLFEKLGEAPNLRFETPSDLFKLFPLAESVFIDGIDTVLGLLLAYSPVLQADAEYIRENATERQIFSFFREVVTLADPFGLVSQLNRQLGRGLTGISSNSQSANGDSA